MKNTTIMKLKDIIDFFIFTFYMGPGKLIHTPDIKSNTSNLFKDNDLELTFVWRYFHKILRGIIFRRFSRKEDSQLFFFQNQDSSILAYPHIFSPERSNISNPRLLLCTSKSRLCFSFSNRISVCDFAWDF